MIPEAIIERKYGLDVDENGKQMTPKDVNRSPNVAERLHDYILTHNAALPENSARRYLWFSDSLTNRQRQKRAKSIIRVKLGKHLRSQWLDGSITFNMCQIDHGKQLEECIEEINPVPVMAVYAQSERSWAVRRMMEDMFSNRRRTYLKKLKAGDQDSGEGHRTPQKQNIISADNDLPGAVSELAVSMNEEKAAAASKWAFEEVRTKPDAPDLSHNSVLSEEIENIEENVSDIDEQIALLKVKKRRLQQKRWQGSQEALDRRA